MKPFETRHISVLLDQVLEVLNPQPGQTIVDCTLGLGGHSAAILERIRLPLTQTLAKPTSGKSGKATKSKTKKAPPEPAPVSSGKLIGIDFDPANIERARVKLTALSPKAPKTKSKKASTPASDFELFHNNFAALPTVLAQAGIERVDGILADLGVASPQIDDPERGFSYRRPGPLDMRMDPTRGQSAAALINRMSQAELAESFLEYGDETDAPIIARMIVQRREIKPFTTTQELAAVICQARNFTMQRANGAKLHPAARTFQALRIMVNRELANLDRLLAVLPTCLKPGGVAAIISFHSGEDRRVKFAFRDGLRGGIYSAISPDVIIADAAEQEANARSRSAKLRWAKLA